MKNLRDIGSVLFGVAITGLGLIHFFRPGFRPVFLPIPATKDFTAVPLVFGLSLITAGLCIVFKRNRRMVAVFLGVELSLFFLLGHLPNRLKYHPEILGVWTDAIKLVALIGGSFIIADQYPDGGDGIGGKKIFSKITPFGLYLFIIMLILFGFDHFLYQDLVGTLIPKWIPLKTFWTYFTGAALLGSGVFIALNIWRRQVALLLALMLFLWLVLLHLPAFFSAPDKDAVNIVSSLECLAFCGTAFLCAQKTKMSNYEKSRKY